MWLLWCAGEAGCSDIGTRMKRRKVPQGRYAREQKFHEMHCSFDASSQVKSYYIRYNLMFQQMSCIVWLSFRVYSGDYPTIIRVNFIKIFCFILKIIRCFSDVGPTACGLLNRVIKADLKWFLRSCMYYIASLLKYDFCTIVQQLTRFRPAYHVARYLRNSCRPTSRAELRVGSWVGLVT